jgi:uncharacterized lipoprotein YddW (UPF0748 family)
MQNPSLSSHLSPRLTRRSFLRTAAIGAAASTLAGCGMLPTVSPDTDSSDDTMPAPTSAPHIAKTEWRAVWISYLEWQSVDFSSESAFRSAVEQMLDNCVSLGLNTVIAQVRPFGDALYASTLYPWSHLCTGTQGLAPAFDPLDILVTEAHARGLSLEAWLNPYRLRLTTSVPPNLADTNLANTHPEWVVAVENGLYLNPAISEAADYVVRGVEELVQNYAVDGIHFDDYFYPTTDLSLDAEQFAASGAADRSAWRRANVTTLVKAVHDAVKAADPTLRFGISPQGNPDNDLTQQYSDVSAWLTAEGDAAIVDYLCPQLYWGYHYTLQSGSQRFAFENISAEWLAMPRASEVSLCFGLGAWRIGDGDGGSNEDSISQWNTGENLAQQVNDLRALGADGYALYRYGSLFASAYPDTAAAECDALRTANA